jgi:hypothetical protein
MYSIKEKEKIECEYKKKERSCYPAMVKNRVNVVGKAVSYQS